MATKLILYGTKLSAPVRTVLLTLNALNLEFELRELNLFNKEQLQTEFSAKNPQHTVPALEDGEHFIVDSHAIAAYLVRKYQKTANDEKLYPKDFYARATVDQRLYYEASTLFATCLKQITGPLFYQNVSEVPQEKFEQIRNAYAVLEQFLAQHPYMSGENLTIADFSIVSTVSTFNAALVPIDAAKWPKLAAWLKRLEALPYYAEGNGLGMKSYATLMGWAQNPQIQNPQIKIPKSKSPNSKSPNSKSPNSKSPNSKSPNSKSPNSKSPNSKSPNSKSPNSKSPNSKCPNSKSPSK